MKNKIIAVALCVALLGAFAVQASAAFAPSKSLQEDTIVEVVLEDTTGKEVKAEVAIVAPDATGSARTDFAASKTAGIMITPVSKAVEVLEEVKDTGKTGVLKDGLTVEQNELLTRVFDTAKDSKDSAETLKNLGMEEDDYKDALPSGEKITDYEAAAAFDVRINDAARELVGKDGKFTVTAEVIGVKKGDKVIVISVTEEPDPNAKDNSTLLKGEVLPSSVSADGKVSFTAKDNGPVLILVNPAK